ncbi:MAG: hypothetical protein WDM91_04810 [Rhizomicrobium sp.]
MKRIAIAAAVGIATVVLLAAAYFLPPYLGWHVDPSKVVAASAILATGASLAAFLLVAMGRPPVVARVAEASPLDKDPVKQFVALFREPEPLTITAMPGQSVGEMTVRLGDLLKNPEKNAAKPILLTIKDSKKDVFNPVRLKELFEKLKPFTGFQHILLLNDKGDFIGYLPAETAKKDFTGENAETKIAKFIVDILAHPDKSDTLRSMKGAGQDDTIAETADIRDATKKMWANDKVQGLVVYRRLKPVGVIDKQSILALTTYGAA